MSAAAPMAWRPVYDDRETVEQFAARQRQAFAAFELAWREGRVSIKLKGYYDQLVRDVGANAYAWWGEERWADAFDVSARTIKRVLQELTRAGLIRRERRYGTASRTYLTAYDRAAAPAPGWNDETADNHQPPLPYAAELDSHHDIPNTQEDTTKPGVEKNQHPAAPQGQQETHDYRQTAALFFGASADPTIGPVVAPDHLKDRHLTVGAAGRHPRTPVADPSAHQVLAREGVIDFVLAPQLAQQAAGELQAVSRYLDTQRNIDDRPRLFAWLATHGFGRQLLAGRTNRPARARPNTRAPQRPSGPSPAAGRRVGRTAPAAPPAPVPVMTPYTALWTQALEQLRAADPPADLVPWLIDTVLLDLNDGTAVVGTPNVFVRDAILAYAAQLEAALAPVVGSAVEVTVVVDGYA